MDSFWALLCPIIVLGGIYTGFFTPTEAATVSVFYAMFVSLVIYRTIKVKEIFAFLSEAIKTYAGLAFVLAFATAFGRVLSLTKATKVVETFILANFHSSFTALTALVFIFLLLGMVMDTGPAIIILAPILLPAMQALGVDPVHFKTRLSQKSSDWMIFATASFFIARGVSTDLRDEKCKIFAHKSAEIY